MISSPIWRNADLGHSHQLGNSDCILMQKKTIPPACFLSSTSLVKSTTLVLLFTFSLGHHQPGYSCSILMQGEAISYNASPCSNANLSWKEFAFSLGIFVQVWWQLTDHLGSGKIAIVVCRYLVRYLCRREERRSEGMHGLSLATKSQELCNPKTVRHQKIRLRIEHNL